MASPPGELTTLLAKLAAAKVDFVLVGGLAAVAQGAPLVTNDVDIVHRRTKENVARLIDFLTTVNARYRGHPGQVLRPTAELLSGAGHPLLMTDLGPLDVLGAIEGGKSYDDLRPLAIPILVGGHPVQVLALRALADLKRDSRRPKDVNALLVLEETLRRSGKA
jgi:hypothetical protein